MALFNRIGPRTMEAQDEHGNVVLYTLCTSINGVAIHDSDVDGVNYIKVGYEFFKKNDITEAIVPDPTFSDNTFDI